MASNEINDLLQRTCVGNGFGPYEYYNGCFLTVKYQKHAKEIDNLEVNDSDIWVTSFPKCGTTWLQELVYLIGTDCNFEKAKTYISERFPFLEIETAFDWSLEPSENSEKPHYRMNSIQYIREFKDRPRMIKTHLPYYLLPKEIRNNDKKPKILHVIRNPKDACTSYYYHYMRSHSYKGNFEEFCTLFLADKVLFAPFWDVVMSYWNRRHDKNILLLKYENMQSDLRSVILQVASFLDKTVTEDQIEKLLAHLNFESMKNNDAVNYEAFYRDNPIKHMRKGIVGDHKNIMSEEIIKEFDEWIDRNDPGLFKQF